MYATIEDVRKEGLTEDEATDERIAEALELATERIDLLTGRTFEEPVPRMIKRAAVLMALRFYIPTASQAEENERERRLISESTDGHSYTLRSDDYSYSKGPTGDAEIDEILVLYRRKMRMACVVKEARDPIEA